MIAGAAMEHEMPLLHNDRENDRLVSVEPMLQVSPKDWKNFLSSNPAEQNRNC